jgi:hypothetical protein
MLFFCTYRLAISLGGDTDTIASMAGAITGAYLGLQVHSQLISSRWLDIQFIVLDEIYRYSSVVSVIYRIHQVSKQLREENIRPGHLLSVCRCNRSTVPA